jgi:hypothetical protein
VHWSANFDEIQDFEHDIRNAFGGTGFMDNADFNFGTRNTTLGDVKAGISPELDALAAYVSSLNEFPKSNYRQTNGATTIAGQNGRQHFINLQCFTCHGGADFTDSSQNILHDIGTIKPSSGQRLGATLTGIDTPTLRGVAYTAPYLHDGSASNLAEVFNSTNAPDGTAHATFRTLDETQQNELLEFLLELDGLEPAVTLAPPLLEVSHSENSILLRWPLSASGFELLSTVNLSSPITWAVVTNAAQTTGGVFTVTLPLNDEKQFFMLRSD